jgi:histidinol dehydrogenase
MNVYENPSQEIIQQLIKRPALEVDDLRAIISDVFEEVKVNGDDALKSYTQKFDKVLLDDVKVSEAEINGAKNSLPLALQQAIKDAYQNIKRFHQSQCSEVIKVETQPGVTCWQKAVPIEKVGLYIPGGTAPLFSTVLMLTIPAQLAGCEQIVLCTPPDAYGNIHPAILFTAQLCGVDTIFKVGGSQAIAALSQGTESIPKVYKIFGPGNQYVTAAKQKAVELGTAIDMPAGPSEVLVFADDTGKANYIASDLLAQAEHGVDSQVVFVTTDQSLIPLVKEEVVKQLNTLPRKEIAEIALSQSHAVFISDDLHAFDFINEYAPEHFIISSDRASEYISMIKNAGSVFIGNFTPESAGDYASGTNHTLPTNGHAKAFSGVNLDAFMKKITFQEINREGLKGLGQTIIAMAEAEQLKAHANAVRIRLEDI